MSRPGLERVIVAVLAGGGAVAAIALWAELREEVRLADIALAAALVWVVGRERLAASGATLARAVQTGTGRAINYVAAHRQRALVLLASSIAVGALVLSCQESRTLLVDLMH